MIFQLHIAQQPIWRKALKWTALLLLPVVLFVTGYSVVKGDVPWVLWTKWSERTTWKARSKSFARAQASMMAM